MQFRVYEIAVLLAIVVFLCIEHAEFVARFKLAVLFLGEVHEVVNDDLARCGIAVLARVIARARASIAFG